jgi:hypothetical protein
MEGQVGIWNGHEWTALYVADGEGGADPAVIGLDAQGQKIVRAA